MIREEQIYVAAARPEGGFIIGGNEEGRIPWRKLAGTHLYALRTIDLENMLDDAAVRGYQILGGYSSERRHLRGFSVAIGAWGYRGKIECRTVDAWALEMNDDEDIGDAVVRIQVAIRAVCKRINGERTTFRASSFRWLASLYTRLGLPLEPDGEQVALPADVATLCRDAHIGGPVLHVRTSLAPFVSLDRDRAYGSVMLEHLPSGHPMEVDIRGNGLDRWRPRDLMSGFGVAEATVFVEDGPLVSLLPLLKPGVRYDRSRTIYPLGRFDGTWCLHELAYLERSGRGRVEKIKRAVTFDSSPVFSGVIRYLRGIEPDLPIPIKRLEHVMYGRCARGLTLSRLGSSQGYRSCLPHDLLDDRAMRRVDGKIRIRKRSLTSPKLRSKHPLYVLTAKMQPNYEMGTMDRPDRSAWITSMNRRWMSEIIDTLDVSLGSSRSGEFVGRVYVDGLVVQATPDQIPNIPGVSIRNSGSSVRIYRSGALSGVMDNGDPIVEGAGLVSRGSSEAELLEALRMTPDMDGGPFAAGRVWWRESEDEIDPRMYPDRVSEPPTVDPATMGMLGFGSR